MLAEMATSTRLARMPSPPMADRVAHPVRLIPQDWPGWPTFQAGQAGRDALAEMATTPRLARILSPPYG